MSMCRSWSLTPALAQRGANRASCMSAMGVPLPAELSCVFQVLIAQALGLAEDVVLRHVGRIAAGGRMPAERLRERADMMRAGAAAHPEVTHAQRIGVLGELGDLEAIAGERVERDGERMIAG